jgi:putative copper export protein
MTALDVIAFLARAVTLAGLVVTTGAVVFHFVVLRRRVASSRVPAIAGAIATAGILLVAPVRLYLQARALLDDGDPVSPMMVNVLHTAWGHALLLQCAAALIAFIAFLLARRRMAAAWLLAFVPALALCCTPAYMGHAGAVEHYVGISILVDSLHVVAAGAWIGALFLLALVIRSAASGDSAAELIESFHPVALGGAATLLVTGVMSLSFRVEHFVWLLHSQYGAILGAKLALTFFIALVGFYHSKLGAARVRAQGPRAVTKTLVAECLLAVAVITVTSVLVATSPPTS